MEPGAVEPAAGEPSAEAAPPPPSIVDRVRAHPLAVVAVGASLIALGHAVWIWTHRQMGGFDPDESGYIASALRIQRTATSFDPLALIRMVGSTGNGITVPVLSAPLTVLGPRDPRTVMLVQPLLLVVTSVGTAGITRRLAGPFAAIGAGLLVATLPTMSTATQSYWYGLGAAASLVVAMWALLASDRCSDRRIWWFGIGLGLLCLARTMSLAYVPALAAAGVVVAGRDRRRLLRLAAAVGVAVVTAAPWYLVNRESIFGYLLSYGYGPRAAKFGSGGVLERLGFRIDRYRVALGDTVFTLLWASALCVAVLVLAQLWGRHRRGTLDPRSELGRRRAGLAVAVALGAGTAALVSTSNNGVWFELPMVPLLVALLVAVIAAGPWWYSAGLALVLAVPSATSLAAHWWILPYEREGPTAHFEYGFEQYDERFGPGRRDEHDEAAAEWAQLYRDVVDELRPEHPGADDPMFTMSGNMQLLNTNSLTLTGELSGWSPRLRVPDTVTAEGRRAELTPTVEHDGRRVERVLVIARHDEILFTPDADVDDFAEDARDMGWRVVSTIPMPVPGEVLVMRHPDGSPEA